MWIVFFWLTVAHAWTDSAESKDWMVVNDTVMGGVSASQVRPHPDGGVTFSGELSLENNGGFASTRTGDIRQDWSNLSALQMEVIGDGRTSPPSACPSVPCAGSTTARPSRRSRVRPPL